MLGFGPISSAPLSTLAGVVQQAPSVAPHDDYNPPKGFRRVTDAMGRRGDALRDIRRELGLEKEPDSPPSFVPPSEIEIPPEPIEAAPTLDAGYAAAVAETLIEAIKQDDETEIKSLRLRRDNDDVLLLLAAFV